MARFWITIWLVLSLLMSFEFYRLNHQPQKALLSQLQNRNLLNQKFDISPESGRPLSLIFGYAGFALMIMTNLYILRKRFSSFQKLGVLRNWLDFHIFCGLMGPTLILFHCNFKVHGLVAVSFWSMIVSVTSGVVGRYVYIQISKIKGDFTREADLNLSRLKSYMERSKIALTEAELLPFRARALELAGGNHASLNPVSALIFSVAADLRLMFLPVPAPEQTGEVGKLLLKQYALNTRKANTVGSFNRLMGYWHTFHTPFAVFMYAAAVIHILAEFWLGAA